MWNRETIKEYKREEYLGVVDGREWDIEGKREELIDNRGGESIE
jgi:hypothetical protein